MRRFLRLLSLLFVSLAGAAETDGIVRSMSQNAKAQLDAVKAHKVEGETLVAQNMRYYKAVVDSARKYYQNFLAKKWGEDNVRLSSQKSFTQYSPELTERESVDYENGQVVIEVLTDPRAEVEPELFTQKLEKLVDEDMGEAIKKDPVANLSQAYMEEKEIVAPVSPPKKEKFLNEIVDKKTIQKHELKTKEVKTKDGKQKKITYVEVPMVPGHLKKLADKYKDNVLGYGKRFDVAPSHIYATIHTESFFNPLAVSYVPAYGLMQLVPTSGGKDAYRALTGKAKILSPDYLYDPKNNIELGSRYIELIKEHYLAGVKDETKLYYCASIAYNAGIGNLYRALTGSKSAKTAAIKRINELDAEELYELLHTSPRLTKEARSYVKKLRDKRKNYLAYDKV